MIKVPAKKKIEKKVANMGENPKQKNYEGKKKKKNPTKTWTEQKKKKGFWVDTLSAQLFGQSVQDGGLSVKIILKGKGRNFSQGRNWRGTSV